MGGDARGTSKEVFAMTYNAEDFLEGLFRQPSDAAADEVQRELAGDPGIVPEDLPSDWFEQWQERVSIMMVNGRQPRERAEALALDDIMEQMRRAGIRLPG
jgi:hypothetical protein